MKHYVTFETAKKLEAAGFERPKIQPGQYWYVFNEKEPTLIIEKQDHKKAKYHNAEFILDELDGVFEVTDAILEFKGVYAPTATDLLEQLGSDFVLWFDESPKLKMWYCAKCSNSAESAVMPFAGNANAAEAVAEAYLSQSK